MAEQRDGRRITRVWRSEGSGRNRMLGVVVIRRGRRCKGSESSCEGVAINQDEPLGGLSLVCVWLWIIDTVLRRVDGHAKQADDWRHNLLTEAVSGELFSDRDKLRYQPLQFSPDDGSGQLPDGLRKMYKLQGSCVMESLNNTELSVSSPFTNSKC